MCGSGAPLERVFGFWRTALLYLVSGLYGALASAVFLPGVVSVGASASVFGLIGAYWGDIALNYCAKCTLRGTGIRELIVATVPNVLVGGKSIGGGTELSELNKKGKLKPLLAEAGCEFAGGRL